MTGWLDRVWIVLGAVVGLSGVAMAAMAAHGLSWLDPAALRMVERAVQMQGWHAPALVIAGIWAERAGPTAHLAGAAFALGTLLFCGSVYSLALRGVSFGLLAPTGGILLMTGWALLGLSALRAR
ncbi:conserved membrane protein of unknown function [Rhodovastum atsumiense]|uniref:DUF423 domain-containing protein n=2 Tax=Rhodovastum atsumiense TaxID=504468 RepID=A0A5M6J289_9PROT|nr:DUF423 domain-containing protein [Rhodovastum atsumiense]CAH2599570.1 conserved membrane protein of unknown function [Rhodovastum atsumiense]